MAQTSRITPVTDHIIHEMALLTGKSKIEIIEEAVKKYRHSERMRMFKESYQRKNKKEQEEDLKEIELLDGMLNDGLEDY